MFWGTLTQREKRQMKARTGGHDGESFLASQGASSGTSTLRAAAEADIGILRPDGRTDATPSSCGAKANRKA